MTAAKRAEILPLSLPPRGLSREQAAAYVGVSPNLFDGMVDAGSMPQPKKWKRRNLWDRVALDAAFSALPAADEITNNPWDGPGAN